MNNQQIHICSKAVLAFLEEYVVYDGVLSPKHKLMDVELKKHGMSMVDFTEYVNRKFNMKHTMIDNNGYYRTFFTYKSREFFRKVISKTNRENKIKRLLKYE